MSASVWQPSTAGIVLSNLSRVYQEFIATSNQTTFVLTTSPYTVGASNLEVYKNGLKVLPSLVTEVAGGTSFALSACTAGDHIEAVVFPGTAATFTTLAAQAQASVVAAGNSEAAAAASAALAASFSTGWQTANNTWTGLNTFAANGLVTSSVNGGQIGGLKNLFINGDMRISQRGATVSTGVGAFTYTLDRWAVVATGAALTVTAGSDSNNSYMQINGAIGNTGFNVRQRIESSNARPLNGKNVTLSLVAYNAGGTVSTCSVSIGTATAGTDNYNTISYGASQSLNPHISSRQSLTFALPADVSKGFEVLITCSAHTAGSFAIMDCQLEIGTTASVLERRPYGLELALCQRYLSAFNNVGMVGTGFNTGTTTALIQIPTKVTPRVAPTGIISSTPSTFQIYSSSGASIPLTSISFAGASGADGLFLNVGVAAGLVAGNGNMLYLNSSASQLLFTGCEL